LTTEEDSLTKLQKDRIHPLIRVEMAKVAETLIKYQTTLARLRDLQDIEKDPDEDDENQQQQYEAERLRRTIRDTEMMIELLKEDMELLESVKTELES
jgi:hypothetical protein